MLKCLYSSPTALRMTSRASGFGSTASRCSYQPIASASSVSDAHSRANVRVSAGSSSGGSWYWSNPIRAGYPQGAAVMTGPGFTLAYEGFDAAGEGLREALTSTGNGYFCTRGAAEWEDADGVHYPGHLRARRLQPRDDDPGRPPGAQRGPGQPARTGSCSSCASRARTRSGSPTSSCSTTATSSTSATRPSSASCASVTAAGRETTLRSRRFVSMADMHHGGDRVDAHAGELVGPGGGRLGDRRPRDQPRRRPLPAARGPPPRSRSPRGRSGPRSSR